MDLSLELNSTQTTQEVRPCGAQLRKYFWEDLDKRGRIQDEFPASKPPGHGEPQVGACSVEDVAHLPGVALKV